VLVLPGRFRHIYPFDYIPVTPFTSFCAKGLFEVVSFDEDTFWIFSSRFDVENLCDLANDIDRVIWLFGTFRVLNQGVRCG
jgi:hypothetical protein